METTVHTTEIHTTRYLNYHFNQSISIRKVVLKSLYDTIKITVQPDKNSIKKRLLKLIPLANDDPLNFIEKESELI